MRKYFRNIMPKRQHAEINMDNRLDLDRELRPQKQLRIQGASSKIPTDFENLMDNWLISARETKKQRNSPEKRDQQAWKARRALHPLSKEKDQGGWDYFTKPEQRVWAVRRKDQNKLSKKTRSLTLQEKSCSFPTEFGDYEISSLYREYWVYGDTNDFLRKLYSQFGRKGVIPEQKVWEIFACLVSELVPEDEKWPAAPVHIIASPNTIWQVGKCMLHVITNGRFWDEGDNALNPEDRGEKFGFFKQKVLQKTYSKSLMKYILGCLSVKDYERFTRKDLMDHFQNVRDVYAGKYRPPPVQEPLDGPYEPIDPRIPKGLTQEEGSFYEGLITIVKDREQQFKRDGIDRKPYIVTITDLAKDYDDLMAMMCLKEFDRMGVIQIEGFVANLKPAEERALFGRGALDSLGRSDLPIGIGSIGDAQRQLNNYLHEFDNTEDFIAPKSTKLPQGQELLKKIFTESLAKDKKLTVLTISSLMDIAQFSREHTKLLKNGTANVVLQGGYRMINDKLVPDPAAANNRFDLEGAATFHKFMQDYDIPSTAWTKVAANATPIYSSLFEFLDETGHPLGRYLRGVQTSQELNFYARCCSDHPFAPHMTQDWAVKTKSTWFAAGHEPDEEYPLGEAMLPYFTKVIAYDALAVVGASGEDVLEKFGIVKPLKKRTDAEHPLHHIIGIPKTDGAGDEAGLPEEENLDGRQMGIAISALMKGSILSVQQKLS
ncbi:hypothetical protein ONS95_001591 [Cadophora gregata]|uniref:uncharacterized protein n=1 Tax=Cadophora gregata TaxID=51156 RepID=UPI0026DD3420|nr:uncharacterized protein ONS95_001591 [Cadophora gregata]KAK0111217.1 hypothetical protein ONS95_001591 [Cadophora gregata]KAK0112311.1 hypothetical protein ONS96_001559 [Cadophora gregata f. sp. sojae]